MKNKIPTIALVFLMTINLIYAFGVSYDPTPITMAAGETKIVNLNLQNMVGDEDLTAKIEIKEGSEIANLEKDTYLVKANTYDTYVPIKIKIPKKETQDNYKIAVDVKTITPGQTGTVSLGVGTGATFYINVAGEIKSRLNMKIIFVIIIIIFIIPLIFLLKKKFKKIK